MNYVEKKIEALENKAKTKQCSYCGKTFEFTRSNQKYCSKDCYKAVKNEKRKEYYKKSKYKSKSKIKQCIHCGKTFEFTHANQKYCSKDCYKAVKNEKRREYYKKAKSKTKQCKLCNKVFEYTHANQKYCSKECYEIVKKRYFKKTESDKLLEILKEREDLRKIKPKDKNYKLKRYIVKAGLNEKSRWTIERDYYFFKPCKFDSRNNDNLYYIHDFNDNQDYSGSLIKLTDTSLSEMAFEYYKNKGNLVFYEKLELLEVEE